MRISDWSSDVCSSDLAPGSGKRRHRDGHGGAQLHQRRAIPLLRRAAGGGSAPGVPVARPAGQGARGRRLVAAGATAAAGHPLARTDEGVGGKKGVMTAITCWSAGAVEKNIPTK